MGRVATRDFRISNEVFGEAAADDWGIREE